MGMQCECPQCGMAFIIPTIEHSAQSVAPAANVPFESQHAELASIEEEEEPLGALDAPASGLTDSMAGFEPGPMAPADLGAAAAAEEVLHIPCPNGHELETPIDMIGQRAMCPHCKVQFKLRREKSVEYLREREIIDRRRARFWFQLAIVAASFVVLLLLVMVAMMIFS